MNSQMQTIELLRLLGDETAEAVLAHLDPVQAERLRARLDGESVEDFDPEERRRLLEEFERFLEFAEVAAAAGQELFPPISASAESSQIPAETADHADGDSGSEGRPSDADGGSDSSVEASSEGTGDSGGISGSGSGSSSETPPPRLTGDPLHDLTLLSIYQVAGALETEQPRTVAILLSEFSHQLTADVLSLLPPDHQAAVVREMARDLEAPPVLVDRIARATLQRSLTLPADPPDRRDRLDRLSDVLRAVPKKLRRNMMAGIEAEDPEMSQALLKRLYRFEDLTSLDPRVVQQVLGEIDGTTLTTAMFQAPQEVIDTILGNLSRRARQSIEEELAFQSSVPESRVQAARESVAEVISRLDQESE